MIARTTLIYGAVAGFCLLLHNVIMIVTDRAGMPLLPAVLLSFLMVGLTGYALHSHLTFRKPMRLRALLRYGLAMSANVPIAFVITWFWHVFAGMRMVWAAPIASACMVMVNFVLSRWAVVGHARAELK